MQLYIAKHICRTFATLEEIVAAYRSLHIDYPKFFKMDALSKLGFLAAEMIFKDDENRFTPREDCAIICFNRSASLDIDTQYETTIADNENYFPSPSLFVYTLPNIVAGEIAIRNKFVGETSFYICNKFDVCYMTEIVEKAFYDTVTQSVLCAWIENFENTHEVCMFLIEKDGSMEFSEQNVQKLYNNK
jgi:3-oxoacyl-[acyl-carrier-protein] synthase-1